MRIRNSGGKSLKRQKVGEDILVVVVKPWQDIWRSFRGVMGGVAIEEELGQNLKVDESERTPSVCEEITAAGVTSPCSSA